MRLERDENGDLFVDPDFLSDRLCVAPGELRRRMRIGLVASVVEQGIGDDEGRRRITIRSGRVAWRAILDAEDRVAEEEVLSLQGRPGPG